ncbi:hypothetical protein [Paenibacillus whitsoniae]|uniref:Nucleotidyltransferase family protein n=1 Tax=Paenibacillus whitsoniae TaxID=2496558 RepID=A0A3S0CWQ9_9BACL|nr:hypothetical protein [Paenibacillus whitsoniae]RTE10470.1 hypothetical protein EJQ19_07340 [Paenibacillus whitsoniae]
MDLLEPILPAISVICTRLQRDHGLPWLIGGSCGLLMQHVDIGRRPRDLDIYIDEAAVMPVHERLKAFATDTPCFNESPIYASKLSHYAIEGTAVEVVGDFQVKALSSRYQVEVSYLAGHLARRIQLSGVEIGLMPLAHELLFNVLRERPDRYEPIAKSMMAEPEKHRPALDALLQRNAWSHEFMEHLERVLGAKV